MTSTEEITLPLFKLAPRAVVNIAPERGEELSREIFGDGKWEVRPSRTEANFYAVPAESAIYLSFAGLASLWCLAYAAFHVSDLASRAQRAEKEHGQTAIDIGEAFAQLKIKDHVDFAEELFHRDRCWPEDLQRPDVRASLNTAEGKVNNVFFGALSWIILHEIAHVHHQDQKHVPADLSIRQEFLADDFATRWILDHAGQGIAREFRVLMITVALSWIFLNEKAVGQGSDHPGAFHRFREAIQHFKGGARSVGLENAAYILKALFDPQTTPPAVDTAQEMFDWTVRHLEALHQSEK